MGLFANPRAMRSRLCSPLLLVVLMLALSACGGDSGDGDPTTAPSEPGSTSGVLPSGGPGGSATPTAPGSGASGTPTDSGGGASGTPTDSGGGASGTPTDSGGGASGPPTDSGGGASGTPTDSGGGASSVPSDPGAPLTIPTNLVATTDDPFLVLLAWDAVPSATAYEVRRDGDLIATVSTPTYTDDSATEGLLGAPSDLQAQPGVSSIALSWSAPTADPGPDHFYSVRARRGEASGAFSDPVIGRRAPLPLLGYAFYIDLVFQGVLDETTVEWTADPGPGLSGPLVLEASDGTRPDGVELTVRMPSPVSRNAVDFAVHGRWGNADDPVIGPAALATEAPLVPEPIELIVERDDNGTWTTVDFSDPYTIPFPAETVWTTVDADAPAAGVDATYRALAFSADFEVASTVVTGRRGALLGLGEPCAEGAECASGLCDAAAGECRVPNGGSCAAGEPCASGASCEADVCLGQGWQSIAVGLRASCAIRADDTLWCWGSSSFGELASGVNSDRFWLPQELEPGTTWQTVGMGSGFVCGLRRDGSLWCWGSNNVGQVGGTENVVSTLTRRSDDAFVELAVGGSHACAIRDDGSLWCWGGNTSGQLAQGDTSAKTGLVRVGTDTDWQRIAAGNQHTCGLRTDNTLWCWGTNGGGQLGIGGTVQQSEPRQVGTEATWTHVTLGESHTCALRSDDSLWCWGRSAEGQVQGTNASNTLPQQIELESNWRSVTLSPRGASTCAVRTGGTLWCWGRNNQAHLGLGDLDMRSVPEQVGTQSNWVSAVVGSEHACGIREDGRVFCWGSNDSGRAGQGDGTVRPDPTPVIGPSDWQTVAANGFVSCGIRLDGTLWCWGQGSDRAHGQDKLTPESHPTRISDHAGWRSVALGGLFGCALRDDGTLWCWGRNNFGQLGLGPEAGATSLLAQVGTDTNWRSVSLGAAHACGIRTDNSLWCWGTNGSGRLGLDDENARNVPTRVDTQNNWQSVSAGQAHTCAVRTNGTLWCWGQSGSGRLGFNAPFNQFVPAQVGTLAGWAEVSAGGTHTCATRTDGTLWCWGWNFLGQLGLGNSGDGTNRVVPTQVGSASDWAEVMTSGNATCGLRTDGTLWCWGENSSGRLGTGDTDHRDEPTRIGSATDWEEVHIGTCGLRTDNSLYCWGGNAQGQVGDGWLQLRTPAPIVE